MRAICGENDFNEMVGPFTFTTEATGVEDIKIEGFNFYPNPVKDHITIRANSMIYEVVIFNAVDQEAYQSSIRKSTAQIDISKLSPGIYLTSVTSNYKTETVKFVKQ